MNMHRQEILERLKQLDDFMVAIDDSEELYSCIIVGGSALVLMNKIYRSTHDIDSINASEEIKPLLKAYNINMNVNAYLLNFPDTYLKRIVKVDIDTKKVKFYTVSLEDLVVSKLCSGREKDYEDITTKAVYSEIDWKLLDGLVNDVCYGMLIDSDAQLLKDRYKEYKERYK